MARVDDRMYGGRRAGHLTRASVAGCRFAHVPAHAQVVAMSDHQLLLDLIAFLAGGIVGLIGWIIWMSFKARRDFRGP